MVKNITKPIIDMKLLNPFYVNDDEHDDSKDVKYCPKCRNMFRWVRLIKTRYGWWTCPICNYRSYSGTK